jgi:Flp pilus assembly protein TadG
LPLLCVLLVGIIEFAQGFILKQKLTNAAREGARIAVQHSLIDISQPLPNSVETIGDAILEYLDNAAIDVSIITTPPTKTGAAEWTYYAGSDALIVIDRAYPVEVPPGSGAFSIGPRVTVRYQYSWSFSEVIKLVAPSSTYASSFLISTEAVMKQVTN